MSGLSINFKIGDHIKKVIDKNAIDKNAIDKNAIDKNAIDKNAIDNKIFQIINIKEIIGGNWHDGYSFSFIATIEPVLNDDIKPETDTEEYCIQYINYMCQINNLYAIKV
jgi:hypothetical protein